MKVGGNFLFVEIGLLFVKMIACDSLTRYIAWWRIHASKHWIKIVSNNGLAPIRQSIKKGQKLHVFENLI